MSDTKRALLAIIAQWPINGQFEEAARPDETLLDRLLARLAEADDAMIDAMQRELNARARKRYVKRYESRAALAAAMRAIANGGE